MSGGRRVVGLCLFGKPVPVFIERSPAFITAEVVSFAVIFLRRAGLLRVHVHVAYGVSHHSHHMKDVRGAMKSVTDTYGNAAVQVPVFFARICISIKKDEVSGQFRPETYCFIRHHTRGSRGRGSQGNQGTGSQGNRDMDSQDSRGYRG